MPDRDLFSYIFVEKASGHRFCVANRCEAKLFLIGVDNNNLHCEVETRQLFQTFTVEV